MTLRKKQRREGCSRASAAALTAPKSDELAPQAAWEFSPAASLHVGPIATTSPQGADHDLAFQCPVSFTKTRLEPETANGRPWCRLRDGGRGRLRNRRRSDLTGHVAGSSRVGMHADQEPRGDLGGDVFDRVHGEVRSSVELSLLELFRAVACVRHRGDDGAVRNRTRIPRIDPS